MRISDWSSDVCSSDLGVAIAQPGHVADERLCLRRCDRPGLEQQRDLAVDRGIQGIGRDDLVQQADPAGLLGIADFRGRSEEHTSELQSLMRNSYAVFCLKNKTPNYTQESP